MLLTVLNKKIVEIQIETQKNYYFNPIKNPPEDSTIVVKIGDNNVPN